MDVLNLVDYVFFGVCIHNNTYIYPNANKYLENEKLYNKHNPEITLTKNEYMGSGKKQYISKCVDWLVARLLEVAEYLKLCHHAEN